MVISAKILKILDSYVSSRQFTFNLHLSTVPKTTKTLIVEKKPLKNWELLSKAEKNNTEVIDEEETAEPEPVIE